MGFLIGDIFRYGIQYLFNDKGQNMAFQNLHSNLRIAAFEQLLYPYFKQKLY